MSAEHSAPDRRARVRRWNGKRTLMAPGACVKSVMVAMSFKFHSNYTFGGTEASEPSPPWRIKIVMACLRTILKDESKTVGNSPLCCFSPTLNRTYLPTYLKKICLLTITAIQNNKFATQKLLFVSLITKQYFFFLNHSLLIGVLRDFKTKEKAVKFLELEYVQTRRNFFIMKFQILVFLKFAANVYQKISEIQLLLKVVLFEIPDWNWVLKI